MKKFLSLVLIPFIAFIVFATHSYANSPTDCGLSSYVVDGGGVGAIANFVINISTSLPTYAFGTTSGTLNCNGWTSIDEQEIYVQGTYKKLSEEASLGRGPHLEALAVMMGCPQDAHKQFIEITHQNYQELFKAFTSPQEQSKQLVSQLHLHLQQNPDLVKQCQVAQG